LYQWEAFGLVTVCPLCKKILDEGEVCGCTARRLDVKQKTQRTKAGKIITGAGGSTAFFVITLFFTMSVFFNALSSGSSFLGVYSSFLGRPGGFTVLAEGGGARLPLFLAALFPSVVICAGLWKVFFNSRRMSGNLIVTLTVIKIAVILHFAFLFLLTAAILAALFLAFSFTNPENFAWGEELTAGLANIELSISFVGTVGVGALMAFYLHGVLKAVGMAADTLRTGERWGDVPPHLLTINRILACLGLVGTGIELYFKNGAAAASAVCMSAFLLCISASLDTVRREL
jgi:hypothetical protein